MLVRRTQRIPTAVGEFEENSNLNEETLGLGFMVYFMSYSIHYHQIMEKCDEELYMK